MKHFYSLLPTTLFLGTLSATSLATDVTTTEYIAEDVIEITTSRIYSRVTNLPTQATIITSEDIENSTAQNISDVLRNSANIDIRNLYGNNSSHATIDINGFGATANSNVLVLVNGQNITPPDQSNISLGSIPLSTVERIEITNGSGAVLYGTGTSAGVINIITKKANRSSKTIALAAGSFDSFKQRAELFNAETNTSIALQNQSSDGYRENNALSQQNIYVDQRFETDGFASAVTFSKEQYKIGLPGGIQTSDLSDIENPKSAKTPEDSAEQDLETFKFSFGGALTQATNWSLNLTDQTKEQSATYVSSYGAFVANSDSKQQNASLSFNGYKQINDALSSNWIVGFDTEDTDYYGFNSLVQKNRALFLLNTLTTENLSLTTGYRQAKTNYNNQHHKIDLFQAGVKGFINDNLSLFVNAERNARIPNADDLGLAPEPLKPQTGDLYTAGFNWLNSAVSFNANIWHGTYKNEIVFDSNIQVPGSFFPGANINVDSETMRKGVATNFNLALNDALSLHLAYTYQESKQQDGENKGKTIPLVSNHTASTGINWAWRRFNTSLRVNHTGERFADGDFANEADTIEAQTTTDLAIKYTHSEILFINAIINNITDEETINYASFDADNNSYAAYPLNEMNVMLEVGYTF